MNEHPLVATAYHEAGHAVVAWKLTLRAGRNVSVIPTTDSAGHTDHFNPLMGIDLNIDCSESAHQMAEHAIMICLAGPISQRKFSAQSVRNWQMAGDYDQAVVIAQKLRRSDESTKALLEWLAIRTRALVEMHWPPIERVAKALQSRKNLTASELLSEISQETVLNGEHVGRLYNRQISI
jgi:hypothetical protein